MFNFHFNTIFNTKKDFSLVMFATIIGLLCGVLSMGFREVVEFVQSVVFDGESKNFVDLVEDMPFYNLLAITTAGGLLVGIIGRFFLISNRPQGMTEVVEVSLKKGAKVGIKSTFLSVVVNIITLGTGGSAGREGPVVHFTSGVSTMLMDKFNITGADRKTLLGCAAASAVGASFNAPIAGVFFAAELITGSYAMGRFVPVVIASVSGTFLTHFVYGDFPAFIVLEAGKIGLAEIPAFITLGILSALVASSFIRGVGKVYEFAIAKKIPMMLCPAIGGFLVGAIALIFPEVLGVGYFATDMAIAGKYTFIMLLMLLGAKILATVLTLGFGGGGGVFSPALFLGAMLGGAFAMALSTILAILNFNVELSYTGYTLAGMGAVAGAVLGAPVSTVFMIFELSGNYSLTLSVLVATVVSARTMQSIGVKSFFIWQLKNRGFDVEGGAENIALRDVFVRDLMRTDYKVVQKNTPLCEVKTLLKKDKLADVFVVDEGGRLVGDVCVYTMADYAFDSMGDNTITALDVVDVDTERVLETETLEMALTHYREGSETIVAVTDFSGVLIGILHENDVLIAYKNVIMETREDERL